MYHFTPAHTEPHLPTHEIIFFAFTILNNTWKQEGIIPAIMLSPEVLA